MSASVYNATRLALSLSPQTRVPLLSLVCQVKLAELAAAAAASLIAGDLAHEYNKLLQVVRRKARVYPRRVVTGRLETQISLRQASLLASQLPWLKGFLAAH